MKYKALLIENALGNVLVMRFKWKVQQWILIHKIERPTYFRGLKNVSIVILDFKKNFRAWNFWLLNIIAGLLISFVLYYKYKPFGVIGGPHIFQNLQTKQMSIYQKFGDAKVIFSTTYDLMVVEIFFGLLSKLAFVLQMKS